MQIINTLHEKTGDEAAGLKGTGVRSSEGKFVLDTTFPYEPIPPMKIKAKEAVLLLDKNFSDSPGEPLAAVWKLITIDDHFKTYLMFKPEGDDSIWVALSVFEWHWQGEAVKDAKGNWDFGKDTPAKATSTKSELSTTLPLWSKNVQDLKLKFK